MTTDTVQVIEVDPAEIATPLFPAKPIHQQPPRDEKFEFCHQFRGVARRVHETAKLKGWKPCLPGDDPSRAIMLMVCELAEAFESYRVDGAPSKHIPDFTCEEEELADVVIRIMNFAVGRELRIAEAILAKAAFNEGRPHKHGGKKF